MIVIYLVRLHMVVCTYYIHAYIDQHRPRKNGLSRTHSIYNILHAHAYLRLCTGSASLACATGTRGQTIYMLLLNIILSHLLSVKGVPIYYNIIRMQVGIHVTISFLQTRNCVCINIVYLYYAISYFRIPASEVQTI